MPNLNRKGPNGEGAMTGRKLGKCNPENKGKTDEEIMRDRVMMPGQGLGQGLGQAMSQQRGSGQGLGQGRGKGSGLGLGRGRGRMQ